MSLLNKLVVTTMPLIPKAIVGRVASRYIAGTTLDDGVQTVKKLNQASMMCTMDLLGEDIKDASETHEVRNNIVQILQAIGRNQLNSNVSVKPTQLGLNIDANLCFQSVRTILEEARTLDNFVRIDMENAQTTDATLEMYRRLRSDGFTNTGVVIQSYLHRSEADVRALVKKGANIRLCKGIYNESPQIAYKERQDIQKNFLKLLQIILEGGSYVGIATHDDVLIDGARVLIDKLGLTKAHYEFQMLLGVREARRDQIVRDGHRLRVYVPYGEQWYAYSTRRLKENPAMAWYITKAIFIR
jgi:proline dehydrogenase